MKKFHYWLNRWLVRITLNVTDRLLKATPSDREDILKIKEEIIQRSDKLRTEFNLN